jgi:pimeloyl-ACP methyl ester carboxylesterase
VGAALAFARSAEAAKGLRLDPARIVLVGHSLGSFAALQAGARDPRVKAIAAISPWSPHVAGEDAARDPQVRQQVRDAWQSAMGPLKGTSGEVLAEEAIRRGPEWRFERLAPRLADRSVLLVGGTRDRGTTLYMAPLAAALKATPSVRLSEAVIDTDHNFSDRRVALARTVIAWLDGQR